ncbi:MAG: DUF5131 family protein [Endozoicomonas sp.]
MSENSKIEWTHHTFNPWWGCSKISEGCRNCYADTLASRYGKSELWKGQREKKSGPWKEILKWDKSARKRGVRERVFVASMADIFEDHADVAGWRDEAFDLFDKLTNLDLLLLTKRPRFAGEYLYERYGYDYVPGHFWIGTTVENQKQAEERIHHLLSIPACVLFLSCEPLLGPLNLNEALIPVRDGAYSSSKVDWVIVGGESGQRARPMETQWALDIKKQCEDTKTAFFFKQGSQAKWKNFKNFKTFPPALQLRQFPEVHP